ncbi:hypothetical protein BATDEDRAFT_23405 [Batrachochytrium dendrobatidis JAM81]|uniref:Uncharacterized protein n=1 Tax=Batrachochytrium dendrobatidis (strain JAM81 / FGSC 10211) TaxID=684364 RepID=F4NYX6_BATDJ|nr:uncharacterized protein BATDEDRAFT_23405 [Batrachochytrium dendrobatidis JAM81]EGF82104.1 hypothetical protein BATDEDRAFT_23405 [Batrachochytrium dendrobatidis JAM81]|eukprot:XP_006677272.1 hypothetical protein BATDEDRAFT_23405 [Batrachochytrium dendrobatidis JAM81]
MDTIYLDPRNNHIYQVVEKRVNNSLLKVAYNYVGNEEAVVLDDVPDSMFRLENPIEVNPSKLLKGRILSLENNTSLLCGININHYKRIKEMISDSCYETNDTIYSLHYGLVVFFKKHYPTCDNAKVNLEMMGYRIFANIKMLPRVIEKQQSLQEKLYRIVMSDVDSNSDDVKEIIICISAKHFDQEANTLCQFVWYRWSSVLYQPRNCYHLLFNGFLKELIVERSCGFKLSTITFSLTFLGACQTDKKIGIIRYPIYTTFAQKRIKL